MFTIPVNTLLEPSPGTFPKYQLCFSNKNKSKLKLTTLVEGDPKTPFSIATTPKCREGRYSFPWIASLYPWSLPYNAEC